MSTATAEAAEASVALTVYNQGTALVRDRRQFQLNQGVNLIDFRDVAASIDPTSVLFKSLTAPRGTTVLEQNYEYDLVGAQALLEKYIDQQIRVVTTDSRTYEGTLLNGQGDIILPRCRWPGDGREARPRPGTLVPRAAGRPDHAADFSSGTCWPTAPESRMSRSPT